MELRTYWKILRRRWLYALVPALIVIGVGVATYQPPPTIYNTGVRLIVGQVPASEASSEDEERYYNWLTSEYIVNGLTDWVRGGTFAAAVSAELAGRGIDVPSHAIGVTADNTRSMLTLSINYHDPAVLAEMMDAALTVLQEQNAQALPQLGGETAVLNQIDTPSVNPIPAGIRTQLDLPIRVALAVIAGLALALIVEYLDPTVRDRADLDQIALPVLGEIPKK